MDDMIPIVLFLVIGVVLCTFFFLRYRGRQEIQHTLRLAMERGTELTPELLEAMSVDVAAGGQRDLRRGIIALALAAATAIFAWVIEPDLLGVAAFPLMLGIAYLALWRFSPRRAA